MQKDNGKTRRQRGNDGLWPALLIMGGSMAAAPAAAIELGNIEVQSKLGQPLRASVAYALAPNEELSRYCVSATAATGSGLPTVANTRIEIADGVIRLLGSQAVSEPMIATRLNIDCPYTPRISREYLMFVDPAGVDTGAATAAAATPATRAPATTARRPRPAAAPAPVANIGQGSRYRVQPGESLSEIVQRIENRGIGLWPAVNALFEANPGAFIDNDPNRLKAGSLLVIPEFVGNEVARFEPPAERPVEPPAVAAPPNEAVTAQPDAAAMPAEPAVVDTPVIDSAADETAAANEAVSRIEAAFEPLPEETVVIPETTLDAPALADNPNRNIAVIEPPAAGAGETAADEPASSLLATVAGGAAAALILWLLFGRRLRDRFASKPVAVAAPPVRRRREMAEDMGTIEVREMKFAESDDLTDENPTLDEAMIMRREFDEDVDVDFSEGFDATAQIDYLFPDEDGDESAEAAAADDASTDIIPPPKIEESAIVTSEVRPDDDDYDMSVIVDVTKMPLPEETTEHDLRAVEVPDEEIGSGDDYTMSQEAEYDILERDYQDELTATQALNLEIEKAAQALQQSLDENDADATTNIELGDMQDMTSELTSQNEILGDDTDLTTQLPQDTAASDDDTAEITARITADDKTVEMQRRDDDTVQMTHDDQTAEIEDLDLELSLDDDTEVITSDGDHTVELVRRDDDTVEMEIESGRFSSRRRGR